MQSRSKKTEIIVTAAVLERMVGRLGREPLLACDLEADSLHHYQEKVCLIQFSTPRESFLIDPLAFSDLSTLAPVMADPSVRKLFHGADYDIRSLHRDFAIEVCNLFDTMIACQFLGEKEVGLAAVLKKRFGVELDKRYQKADWSKRPLPAGMIDYAVEDTRLLIELYRQLAEELRAKGRLSWVEEECELLSRVRTASRGAEPFFFRFKGAAGMEPRSLAVLEQLLRYRDEKASQRDVPAFKIVGNETIRELAVKMPRKAGELANIAGLTPKLLERYGPGFLDAVAKGMACLPDKLPVFPRLQRPVRDSLQEERLKRLKQWREIRSRELGIDGGILANNALLEALSDADPKKSGEAAALVPMKRWQRAEFGAELMELLRRV
jgi:ribonuclease D